MTSSVRVSPVTVSRTTEAGDAVLAEHLDELGVGHEADLLVGLGALEHDPRRAELLAAVHQGDAAGELGEEGGLLHRGVAAADHDDVLVAEEEAVAGGAGADAAAEQAFSHRERRGSGLLRPWRG